jgi:hypothetical protein
VIAVVALLLAGDPIELDGKKYPVIEIDAKTDRIKNVEVLFKDLKWVALEEKCPPDCRLEVQERIAYLPSWDARISAEKASKKNHIVVYHGLVTIQRHRFVTPPHPPAPTFFRIGNETTRTEIEPSQLEQWRLGP